MNNANFSKFTKKFQKTISLRNELRPEPQTKLNLEKKQIVINDEILHENYLQAKTIIDKYHQHYIDDVLTDFSSLNINWETLKNLLINKNNPESLDDSTRLETIKNEQSNLLKDVASLFSKSKEPSLKELLGKEIITKLIPNATFIDDNEKQIIKNFEKFTTYFSGFNKTRENIYTADFISTSIAYRIVVQNFTKFAQNLAIYDDIVKKSPSILNNLSPDLLKNKNISEIFSINFYNSCVNQNNIDFYNNIINGLPAEPGKEKVQGLNELINLERQKNKQLKLPKFYSLFKQILSDKDNSIKIDIFESDQEVISTIKSYFDSFKDTLAKITLLFNFGSEDCTYDFSKIYVDNKNLNSFSHLILGDWSALQNIIVQKLSNTASFLKTIQKMDGNIDNILKNKSFSLDTLNNYFSNYVSSETNIKIPKDSNLIKLYSKYIKDSIYKIITNCDDAKFELPNQIKTSQERELIKSKLDLIMDLFHVIKLIDTNKSDDIDNSFYSDYDEIRNHSLKFIKLYNKVRNFVTKKPYSLDKFKLNFENSQLAHGWDTNKVNDNKSILMWQSGKLYLAIIDKNYKLDLDFYGESNSQNISADDYKVMIYKQFKVITLIPKCSVQLKQVKKHFENSCDDYVLSDESKFAQPLTISKNIFETFTKKEKYDNKEFKKFEVEYKKINEEEYNNAVNLIIEFCIKFLKSYKSTQIFNIDSLSGKKFYSYADFINELSNLMYNLTFYKVPAKDISNLEKECKLYLFKIHNKDFADGHSGKKNLHTMYLENIFSDENLKDVVIKLNGQAELFFRKKSINTDQQICHKEGSCLINKITSKGESIPDSIYTEIYKYENSQLKTSLSADALKYYPNIIKSVAKHKIIKDKRFTEDKYFVHISITINFKEPGKPSKFNEDVLNYIRNNSEVNIIGIDRGERNLIYINVINQKGEIINSQSFNTINSMTSKITSIPIDYDSKLANKEKERIEGRKSWNLIDSIVNLKEGYLSIVIHEIAKKMIEYNAILILENLNTGFKRIRGGIREKAVYQKFEKMLIDKLNYLVFKDFDLSIPGGLLNGYQLTNKFESFNKLGTQCGFLFYVPAAYTSKIDPTTGFSNILITKGLSNAIKKREFFAAFDDIFYSEQYKSFCFKIDLSKDTFKKSVTFDKNKWDLYSYGNRISYNTKQKSYENIDLTLSIRDLFERYNIDVTNGNSLKEQIISISTQNAKFYDRLFFLFMLMLQMRNSNRNTEEDYIVSPILNSQGYFYNSTMKIKSLPKDGDDNGAYNIALKGLMIINRNNQITDAKKKLSLAISNVEWFKFTQNRDFKIGR